MLPARTEVAGIQKNSKPVTPAQKIIATVGVDKYNRLSVQWPPKQPNVSALCGCNVPALERQDLLPQRTHIAGIKQDLSVVKPVSNSVVRDSEEQSWPPSRPSAALRHMITSSVDDRRLSWSETVEDDLECSALPAYACTSPSRSKWIGFTSHRIIPIS